jgi:hypothetical protein
MGASALSLPATIRAEGNVARANEQLVARAHGLNMKGETEFVSIYRKGGSWILNRDFQRKVCHPSVRDMDGVKREIALVYHLREVQLEVL